MEKLNKEKAFSRHIFYMCLLVLLVFGSIIFYGIVTNPATYIDTTMWHDGIRYEKTLHVQWYNGTHFVIGEYVISPETHEITDEGFYLIRDYWSSIDGGINQPISALTPGFFEVKYYDWFGGIPNFRSFKIYSGIVKVPID